MSLVTEPRLRNHFPDLEVLSIPINGVVVTSRDEALEEFKRKVEDYVRGHYTLEALKDIRCFRLYRDFFWGIGIDPTKIRPAAEALIRRILGGRHLPTINNLVDSYNLASVKTCIAMAAFDSDRLKGRLTLRFAANGEEFLGIAMDHPLYTKGGEVVIADEERLISIYPYRDGEYSKVTTKTRNVLVIVCGVPGIGEEDLQEAADTVTQYITRYCGVVGSNL
ncbi:MAG: phenylalanine--tRNA ligase beta subunit-related protein [Candidatus Bathyarchaeia archaeon]